MAKQNQLTSAYSVQSERDATPAWTVEPLPLSSLSPSAGQNDVSSASIARGPLFLSGTGGPATPLSLVDASSVATDAMKSGALSGFDVRLAALYYAETSQAGQMSAFIQSVEQFAGSFSADGKYVLIDTTAANGNGASLLTELQALGLKNGSSFGAVASGWLPVSNIVGLAQTSNLRSASESAFTTHTGLVTTQADTAQHNDVARSTYGVTGAGVRVGVLSDSFDTGGYSTASYGNGPDNKSTNIASNDLPVDTQILHDTAGEDEGRAMAQLIHDLAPGASIDFATAFNGQAAMANYILELAAKGDKIIVDDVSYFAELSYQNGIISQAINQVAAGGVSYFSSAGNDGFTGYESAWVAGGTQTINGRSYTLMNFAPGQDYLNVSASSGGRVTYSLQWDNPGASAGGTGATSDLDLFLVAADGTTVRASSVTNNIGGDPVELFQFQTASTATVYQLRVGLASGSPAPGEIRLIASGNGLPITLQNVASNTNPSTLTGHHGATGQMAVAAASFFRTPYYGTTPPTAETFSSRGYDKILFDDNGVRLAAPVLTNVAFTAVDGGNTTFFVSDSTQDTDALPNFFGTSAAAPDAAATAALLLQAEATLTPADIRALLADSAIDMDDAATAGFDTGYDSRTGTGLIQADVATGFLSSHVISNAGQTTLIGTHLAETINGGTAADTLYGMDGNDIVNAGAGADKVYGGSGNDVLYGNQDNDQLFGESGNDTLYGGQGDDILSGGAGDDVLEGGLGNDVINGGTGVNTASYAVAPSGVTVNLSGGTASGGAGNDTLYSIQNVIGSAYGDVITGSLENNVLSGGAGSDELHGSDGDDILDGGAGQETLYADTVDRPDVVKPQTQANISMATALVLTDANFDLVFNYEVQDSRSVPHATVVATAASGGFEYYAVTVAAGATAVFDIDRSGIDTVIDLLNSAGAVIASNDDDYADPGSGQYNSLISYTFTTAGTYYLRVKDFNSSTSLHAGDAYTLNVSLSSASPNYTGTSSPGFDVIDGGAGTDTATYASATAAVTVSLLLHDQVQQTGGGGPDFLTGIENLTGSNYADVLTGDGGANVLTGGLGTDTLNGGFGADTLYGNQDNDILYGNQDNDVLYGGQGNDTLYGGQGDDILIGGIGADSLSGNAGADTFRYAAVTDSTAASYDTITDFSSAQGDKVDLRAVHTGGSADYYNVSSSGGQTFLDVHTINGDMHIVLTGTNVLSSSDILWT